MSKLHYAGLAKEYPQLGTAITMIEWEKGDRLKGNYVVSEDNNFLIE